MRFPRIPTDSRPIACGFAVFLLVFCAPSFADGPVDNNPDVVRPVPKPGISIPLSQLKVLADETTKLGALLEPLRRNEHYADVAIFHRAVRVALEDHEFFAPGEIDAAKKLLATGIERAEQLQRGETPWLRQTGLVVRGYVSQIDHTPQPYGLIIPESYNFEKPKPHRLDLWFHGRGEVLSEVNFISQRMTQVGPISPPETIVLHPYGRYCNANKFAGEVDTFEALSSAQQSYKINDQLIAARGFSMGGAACWQFAVHYPDRWFAATPGAGFSETPEFLKFFQKETLNPPWWEEKLWRWYDCPGYVANLKHLNVVAYSGEDDIQKQAADLMEAAYETKGMKLAHLIAPKTGHSITPDAAKDIEAKLSGWAARPIDKRGLVDRVDFVTYSLMYNSFPNGEVLGLKEHWEPASLTEEIDADGALVIKTKNIASFSIHNPLNGWKAEERTVIIDGQSLKVDIVPMAITPDNLGAFALVNDVWTPISKRNRPSLIAGKKSHSTCGPIDHAFMSSFIIVKPSGQCAYPQVQKWVDAEMNRAIAQWRRQFRGDARVKLDTEITDEDIKTANLVLWGDRQSNTLINNIADKLPIRWSNTEITAGDQKFDAPQHALIAIYPNPLNTSKYVVLNSGFTYREYDYLNNARQTPKLPDWAIVDLRTPPNGRWPGKIVAADFFNEEWQLKPPHK